MPKNNKVNLDSNRDEKENRDVLLWKYLSQEDLQNLENMIPTKIENYLSQKFELEDYDIDLRQACILDFYVTQYWWAIKEKGYNHEQVSSFFSLIYILMDNLRSKNLPMHANLEELKKMLIELTEKTKIFTDDQTKDLIAHITVTFFQNCKLYEFVLNEPQNEIIVYKEIDVECPKPPDLPYPAPLDEAMPDQIHRKYVLKIPDEPSPEELERQLLEKSENIIIPDKVIEQIHNKFEGLSLDEARKIIFEVTNELITDLKVDMRNKIKDRETALINELTKGQGKNQKK